MKQFLFFITTKSYGIYINLLCFISPKKATLLAYSLFSQPRKGKLNSSKLPSFLAEAKKETFEKNKQSFQTYRWEGDEKIIFLVHGWQSNSARWRKLIPHLQETGHTIIAIDAPAHGLSGGKEFNVIQYAAYMETVAKKYTPNYIIGHSIGGKTSLYYQATYQNPSIEKIVLLGAPADFKIIFENYIKLLSLNSRMVQLLHQHYWDYFQIKVEHFSAKHFVSSIKAKGFVIHDVEDKIVLYKEGEKITNHWKASVLETTKGLGHSLQNKEVYKKIVAFLSDAN
ncbi:MULTISPECIES: alpha/beta hydrolase [Flavobacterium]|uniref:Alpha/beta hydrolase n=1 Tax=Flavobacterium keumense TaxID=1306518 RepID=A0ABY8N4M1_9FLAO|nr:MULTISPECIES: alpha/beta hydrolase [Flavobacterium]WGK94595.1 alpha/beta hydrolase [Flavobacterium keumense]